MGQEIKGWQWIKVESDTTLPDGRIESVSCQQYPICFSRYNLHDDFTQLPCPHLEIHKGTGSLDQGWLHCPWHGWELLPLALTACPDGPGYRLEFRSDGVFLGTPIQDPPLLLLPPPPPDQDSH